MPRPSNTSRISKSGGATQSSSKHTPKGAAITELIMAILLTNGRLMRSGDDLLHDLGLSGARWQVLAAIKSTPKTVPQIARQYELSRQGVLWIVNALVEDRLVKYVDNPDHKRAKLLMFTEQGRRVHNEIERRQRIWADEISAALNLEEIRTAAKVVSRFGEIIKVSDG